MAGRLEPAEAARLLSQALAQEKDPSRRKLAPGLVALAGRLEPAEAVRLLKGVKALAQEKDGSARGQLAVGLAAVAGRLSRRGARVCAEAARCSTRRWPRRRIPARGSWPLDLAAVAGRLEPAEGARVCAEPARLLDAWRLAQEKDAFAR